MKWWGVNIKQKFKFFEFLIYEVLAYEQILTLV